MYVTQSEIFANLPVKGDHEIDRLDVESGLQGVVCVYDMVIMSQPDLSSNQTHRSR